AIVRYTHAISFIGLAFTGPHAYITFRPSGALPPPAVCRFFKGILHGETGGIPPPLSGHATQSLAPSLCFFDQKIPVQAARLSSSHFVRIDGAALRRIARRRESLRPDTPAQRRAARRTHHRERPGAGRERPSRAAHAGGDLAGECRWAIPPQGGPAQCAAGPEL